METFKIKFYFLALIFFVSACPLDKDSGEVELKTTKAKQLSKDLQAHYAAFLQFYDQKVKELGSFEEAKTFIENLPGHYGPKLDENSYFGFALENAVEKASQLESAELKNYWDYWRKQPRKFLTYFFHGLAPNDKPVEERLEKLSIGEKFELKTWIEGWIFFRWATGSDSENINNGVYSSIKHDKP